MATNPNDKATDITVREYLASQAMIGLLANDPEISNLTNAATIKADELIKSLNEEN